MSEVPIEPRGEFSFIRLPRRGLSERTQLLRNFDGIPPPNNDVLFYKLFRSPSDRDDPPDGGDSRDRVEVLRANEYQTRVNEIARGVIELSRRRSETPSVESTRKEWGQYLNVMYIALGPNVSRVADLVENRELGGGIEQALACLRDPGFHFRELVSPEALEGPSDSPIPPFGVFLKGDFRARYNRDQDESVLVVRIPYLGPERISPSGSQENLEPQESWSLSKFVSQVVTGQDNPLEDDESSVHQAIFIVLNNAAIMMSKSKEDEGARMVLPGQNRVGAFHVLVHMISETLRGGDRNILAGLESQATLLEIRSLLLDDGWSREMAGRVLGRIIAVQALVGEQTAILEDLKDIFGRAVPELKQQSIHSNMYTKNMVSVPVLSGPAERASRQMSYAAAALETIIEERRQFKVKGAGIFERLQKTQGTMATYGQAQELKRELSEQMQALRTETEIQGKTLSVFTYFTAGGSERNGAIGTSLGGFWAVAAPCMYLIATIAAYFLLESQYELRQFLRLLTDLLKLKGFQWPMTRADAAFQRSYLMKLPKYRVLAVPAGSRAESYYLKGPERASGAGGPSLSVRVENTAYPSEFRFDEKNGWLFRDEVDEYDYMYYVHVNNPTVPPGGTELPLIWETSRLPMEVERYVYRGAFQTEREDFKRFLIWRFCSRGGIRSLRPRWDTKAFSHAGIFAIGREDQGRELFVRSPELPAIPATPATPTTPAPPTYRLELIPVAMETL